MDSENTHTHNSVLATAVPYTLPISYQTEYCNLAWHETRKTTVIFLLCDKITKQINSLTISVCVCVPVCVCVFYDINIVTKKL